MCASYMKRTAGNAVLVLLTVAACVSVMPERVFAADNDVAASAYEKGKEAAAKKQWPTALSYFDAAIKAKPDFAKAFKERSLVHEAMGHHLVSIEDLARAGELDRSLEPPWMLSGPASPWHTQQDINSAKRTLEKEPNNIKAMQALAGSALTLAADLMFAHPSQQTEAECAPLYKMAIPPCTQALSLFAKRQVTDPYQILPFYNLRARAYTKTGETDKAILDYTEAINFMPRKSVRDFANVVGLYGSRAAVYESRKETDKALADYDTIIEMKAPAGIDREIYYLARADLWKQRKDFVREKADVQSAIDSYSRRIAQTPYPWIIELRAELYARLHEYGKAVADMQRVVKEEPTDGRKRKLADYQKHRK